MKVFQFLLFFFLFNTQIKGQNSDYKLIKDSLARIPSIGNDSLTLATTRIRLETLDTNSISKNIHLYYQDLGKCYYRLYLNSYDTSFLTKAISAYGKALHHKKDNSSVLLDISLCHYLSGNCKKSIIYLDKYKKITPKKSRDTKKTDLISKHCTFKRNTLFFELFGNGYFYSVNYERLFDTKYKTKIALRIGFEYLKVLPYFRQDEDRSLKTFPTEVSGLYPIFKKNHFLELGIGLDYYTEYFGSLNHTDHGFLLASRIGYRFQRQRGGLFIKVGFVPLYLLYEINPDPVNVDYNDRWLLTGGLGVGYTF